MTVAEPMVSNMLGMASVLRPGGRTHYRSSKTKANRRRFMRLGSILVTIVAFNVLMAEALPAEEIQNQLPDELREIQESPKVSPKVTAHDAVQPMDDNGKDVVRTPDPSDSSDLHAFLTASQTPLTREEEDNDNEPELQEGNEYDTSEFWKQHRQVQKDRMALSHGNNNRRLLSSTTLHPLYRCYKAPVDGVEGYHFTTKVSTYCSGYDPKTYTHVNGNVHHLGVYVSTNQVANTVRLMRCQETNGNQFVVTGSSCPASTFFREELGYVWPTTSQDANTAIYRCRQHPSTNDYTSLNSSCEGSGHFVINGAAVGYGTDGTNAPTNAPTNEPTNAPTNAPTNEPTNAPTNTPTVYGCQANCYPADEANVIEQTAIGQIDYDPNSYWKLVRRTAPSNGAWGNYNDNLSGSAQWTHSISNNYGYYPGTDIHNPLADRSWAKQYDEPAGTTEMLFATGDRSWYLVTNYDQVKQYREGPVSAYIKRSKSNTAECYTTQASGWTNCNADWYNRQHVTDDPWISVEDHASHVVYGEGGTATHFTANVGTRNGANVFIRVPCPSGTTHWRNQCWPTAVALPDPNAQCRNGWSWRQDVSGEVNNQCGQNCVYNSGASKWPYRWGIPGQLAPNGHEVFTYSDNINEKNSLSDTTQPGHTYGIASGFCACGASSMEGTGGCNTDQTCYASGKGDHQNFADPHNWWWFHGPTSSIHYCQDNANGNAQIQCPTDWQLQTHTGICHQVCPDDTQGITHLGYCMCSLDGNGPHCPTGTSCVLSTHHGWQCSGPATNAPTFAPTQHQCDDGSHGCDKNQGGICVKTATPDIHDNYWECTCAPAYHCIAGCSTPWTAHTCALTAAPTKAPTKAPTDAPTKDPTNAPTDAPTKAPSYAPTDAPTNAPTQHADNTDDIVVTASGGKFYLGADQAPARTLYYTKSYKFVIAEAVFDAHPFALKETTYPFAEYTEGVRYQLSNSGVTDVDYATFYSAASGDRILILSPMSHHHSTDPTTIEYYCKFHSGMGNDITMTVTPAPTKAPTDAPTDAPTHAPTKEPTIAPTQGTPQFCPFNSIDLDNIDSADLEDVATQPDANRPACVPGNMLEPGDQCVFSHNKYNCNSATITCTSGGSWDTPEWSPAGPDCSVAPTPPPTKAPTDAPTDAPTKNPTKAPTDSPTLNPTKEPTSSPSSAPTESPSHAPSASPTIHPTGSPTVSPTPAPQVRKPTPGAKRRLLNDVLQCEVSTALLPADTPGVYFESSCVLGDSKDGGEECQAISNTHNCEPVECQPNEANTAAAFSPSAFVCTPKGDAASTEVADKMSNIKTRLENAAWAQMGDARAALSGITAKAKKVPGSPNDKPVVEIGNAIKDHFTNTMTSADKKRMVKTLTDALLKQIKLSDAALANTKSVRINDHKDLGFDENDPVLRAGGVFKKKIDIFDNGAEVDLMTYGPTGADKDYGVYTPLSSKGDCVIFTLDGEDGSGDAGDATRKYMEICNHDDDVNYTGDGAGRYRVRTKVGKATTDWVVDATYGEGATITFLHDGKQAEFVTGSVTTGGQAAASTPAPTPPPGEDVYQGAPLPTIATPAAPTAAKKDSYISQAVTGLTDCSAISDADKATHEDKYATKLTDDLAAVHKDSLKVRLDCVSGDADAGTITVSIPGTVSSDDLTTLKAGVSNDDKGTFTPTLGDVTADLAHAFTAQYPARSCGNGVLEALGADQQGRCPGVGSLFRDAASAFAAGDVEACDSSQDAYFGEYNKGCGRGASDNACKLDKTSSADGMDVITQTDIGKLKMQLASGVVSAGMSNYAYNPTVTGSESENLNVCLYSTKLVDDQNAQTFNLKDAVACELTGGYTADDQDPGDDRVKYTTLQHCYNGLKFGDISTDNAAVLAEKSGARLSAEFFGDDDHDLKELWQLNGHKCQYPVKINIMEPVGGDQSWDHGNGLAGFYDFKFRLDDPSWPSVHPSSNEFISQQTRFQYSIVCDYFDQEQASPDDDGNCENDDKTHTTKSGDNNFKCGRLGAVKNPCDLAKKQWSLWTCAGESCTEINSAREYTNQYNLQDDGGTEVKGTEYTFEHDSQSEKNLFSCETKDFNNDALKKADLMLGEATEAQYKHICATQGQEEACASGLGEITHYLDTSGAGDSTVNNDVLYQAIKGYPEKKAKWQTDAQLDALKGKKWASDAVIGCDPFTDETTDSIDATCVVNDDDDDDNTVVKDFFMDIQKIKRGCSKRLMLKVNPGVSGAMTLKVVVKNYLTAEDGTNADIGYTFYSQKYVPVSIKATVKDLDLLRVGGDANAAWNIASAAGWPVTVNEADSVQFLPGASAFGSMVVNANNEEQAAQDDTTRKGRFSRTTRSFLEVVDCTDSHKKMVVEQLKSYPRFRVSNGATETDTEDYWAYVQDMGDQVFTDTYNANHRLLQAQRFGIDSTAWTLEDLKTSSPWLMPRTPSDWKLATQNDFWDALNIPDAERGVTSPWPDQYHGQYSREEGLCLKARLSVVEPSSCSVQSIESEPWNLQVLPVNTKNPTIEFKQQKRVWEEDQTVPLRVSVDFPEFENDSGMAAFAYIEVEDLNVKEDTPANPKLDKNNGGGADFFSYGWTRGPAKQADGTTDTYSDAISNTPGITRVNAHTWRSYSNDCWRQVFEQNAAGSPVDGGIVGLDMNNVDYGSVNNGDADASTNTIEQCLRHSRQTGEAIWGQDPEWPARADNKKHKIGLHVRPRRKETKNNRFRVTVYMIDGDIHDWHKDNVQLTSAFADIEILWTPRSVRYNQREIYSMQLKRATEDASFPLAFNDDQNKLQYPRAYQENEQVCTYVKNGGTGDGVDDFDTSQDDHDRSCYHADTSFVCTGNVKCLIPEDALAGQGCTPPGIDGTDADLRLTCKHSGADHTRGEIEKLVIFDESEGGGHGNLALYNDGSSPWNVQVADPKSDVTGLKPGGSTDTYMQLPEQQAYQPAGNNVRAKPHKQWYRFESCGDGTPGATDVSHIVWCSEGGSDAKGRYYNSQTSLMEEDVGGVCDISQVGEAYDKAAADSNVQESSPTALRNSLSFDLDTLRDSAHWKSMTSADLITNINDANYLGHSRNFWTVVPKNQDDGRKKIVRDNAICFQGLANFCTSNADGPGTSTRGVESPLNLRIVAIFKDSVDASINADYGTSSGKTYTARSKSNTDMGTMNLHVDCVRQKATPIALAGNTDRAPAWGSAYDYLDGTTNYGKINYVEERNKWGAFDLGAPPARTWELLEPDQEDISDKLMYGQQTDETAPEDGYAGTYQALLDCGKNNQTDILCTDRIAFKEASTFHDQHFGRFKVDFQMMKTCDDGDTVNTVDPSVVGQWESANGLFDVYLQYFDNFQNWNDDTPGNAFNENEGAGFKISDSWEKDPDAPNTPKISEAFVQKFDYPYTTAESVHIDPCDRETTDAQCSHEFGLNNPKTGQQGSVCQEYTSLISSKELSNDGDGEAFFNNLRGTSCVFRNAGDVVGLNTYTWDQQVGMRAYKNELFKPGNVQPNAENKCQNYNTGAYDVDPTGTPPTCRPGGGQYTGIGANDFLEARELSSLIRVRSPHRFSNCIRFKMTVKVGNDDRNGDVFVMGTASDATKYQSEKHELVWEQKPIATLPDVWVHHKLGDADSCSGETDSTSDCYPQRGTQALYKEMKDGNAAKPTAAYADIDTQSFANGDNKAMIKHEFIAGYRTGLKVMARTGSTDIKSEYQSHATRNAAYPEDGYEWTHIREKYRPSGETLYMTIESKYDVVTDDATKKNRFCAWQCPYGVTSCPKSGLQRFRSVPLSGNDADSTTRIGDNDYFTNFDHHNVNCQECDPADNDANCKAYKISEDHSGVGDGTAPGFGKVMYCKDPFGLDAALGSTCPGLNGDVQATELTPGFKYSIKCSKKGDCPEWKNLHISYPANQIENDVLELCYVSRDDHRGKDGWQKSCVSVNVMMKPSITVSEVGFAIQPLDTCDKADTAPFDPDTENQRCPTGMFGGPLQGAYDDGSDGPFYPDQIVPSDTSVFTVSMSEEVLHGDITSCMSNLASDATNAASTEAYTQNCFRLFTSFPDDSLMLVAPVGIQMDVRTVTMARNGINGYLQPYQLATGLQLGCNEYTKTATGADSNTCQGRFVWITSGSNSESGLMYYQKREANGEEANKNDISDKREIHYDNFVASAKPASKQSWSVGDLMTPQDFVMFGSDDNVLSASDYSFKNSKCEPNRLFDISLLHSDGYSSAVVDQQRSDIRVEVVDNDFVGLVELFKADDFTVRDTNMKRLSATGVAKEVSLSRDLWTTEDSGSRKNVFFALGRSRRPSESGAAVKHIGLKKIIVEVAVRVDGLTSTQWSLKLKKTHGEGSSQGAYTKAHPNQAVSTSGQFNTEQLVQNAVAAGITGQGTYALVTVEMDAMSMEAEGDDCADCLNGEPGACSAGWFACDKTEGSLSAEVPWQWYQFELVSVASQDSCGSSQNAVVEFNVHNVKYPDDAETEPELRLQPIDCQEDGRQPMGQGNTETKNDKFKVTLTGTSSSDKVKASVPWRMEYAGLYFENEKEKDVVLNFNAGMDGTTITFPETEHRDCSLQADNTYKCTQRSMQYYMCAQLRDDEPINAGNGLWDTNDLSSQTIQFYTDIEDSAFAWANMDGKYKLECPPQSYLNSIKGSLTKLSCTSMSTVLRTDQDQTSTAVFCGDSGEALRTKGLRPANADWEYHRPNIQLDGVPTDEYDLYCKDKPRKLLWEITIPAKANRNILKCPTDGTDVQFESLPYVNFTTMDDQGVINLSKRPKLCMEAGKMSTHDTNVQNQDSCAYFGARTGLAGYTPSTAAGTSARCLDMRIQDDEMTHINHAANDADSFRMNTQMAAPAWDTSSGSMQIQVSNNYPVSGNERQLINVGPGKCLQGDESSLEDVWNKQPLADILSNCDLLDSSKINIGTDPAMTMDQLYEAIFGVNSEQLTPTEFNTGSREPFGFTASDGKQNYLFPEPRNMEGVNLGNKWRVFKDASAADENPTFVAELAATLEGLRACVDRSGNSILSIKAESGFTTYSFHMHSTIVTAQRPDELAWHHWSPVCTERAYEITVSNTMFALGGMTTDERSHIYVDSMGYLGDGDGVCQGAASCGADKGPEHPCPIEDNDVNAATLKMFEYKVNMDFKINENVVGNGQSVKTYYGLGSHQDDLDNVVTVNNCYGAEIHSITPVVDPNGADAGNSIRENGVTRTTLTFRTNKCFELRPDWQDSASAAVPDVFVTCKDRPEDNTRFDFRTRMWECTEESDLKHADGPGHDGSTCILLPDWVHVHITLGFVQDVETISYTVNFETKMAMYRSIDHRLPSGGFVPNNRIADVGDPKKSQPNDRDIWRAANILARTAAQPVPVISKDANLAISLGFTDGSPLASTMTSAIRGVRLCRFKKYCYLPGINQYPLAAHGAEKCTRQMLFVDASHSPYAHWARNTIFGSSVKGCSEKDTSTGAQTCKLLPFAGAGLADPTTAAFASEVPYLTCDKDRWEDFLVSEVIQSTQWVNAIFGEVTGIDSDDYQGAANQGKVIRALQPVKEAQLMIDNGATTFQAEDIHGNCELESHTEDGGSEIIYAWGVEEADTSKDVTVSYLFPKESLGEVVNGEPVVRPSGVCTCKGQKAYNWADAAVGGANTYRPRNKRQVIYSPQKYSPDEHDAANLHLCPWQITPQDKDYHTPQNSVDVFHMSLKNLQYDTDWNFEISAVVLDHNAFTADILGGQTDNIQFTDAEKWPLPSGQARRLLMFPQASYRGAYKTAAKADAARRTLSYMIPESSGSTGGASAEILMPQGPVSQTQSDNTGVSQGSAGGFILVDSDQVTAQSTSGSSSSSSLASDAGLFNFDTWQRSDYDSKEDMINAIWNMTNGYELKDDTYFDLLWLGTAPNAMKAFAILNEPFVVGSDVASNALTNYSFWSLVMPLGGTKEYVDASTGESKSESEFMPMFEGSRPCLSVVCGLGLVFVMGFLSFLSIYSGNYSPSMNYAHGKNSKNANTDGKNLRYSVSFYRVPGTALDWSGDCTNKFVSFVRAMLNETICLLGGFYVMNFVFNCIMWTMAIVPLGVLRVVAYFVDKCSSEEEEKNKKSKANMIREFAVAVEVFFQTLFKVLLDYSCVDMIQMFASSKVPRLRACCEGTKDSVTGVPGMAKEVANDITKIPQKTVDVLNGEQPVPAPLPTRFDSYFDPLEAQSCRPFYELLKFLAMLVARFFQITFATALLIPSFTCMLIHYLAYWVSILIDNNKACMGCLTLMTPMTTVLEKDILDFKANYDNHFDEKTASGLAMTDWHGMECGGLAVWTIEKQDKAYMGFVHSANSNSRLGDLESGNDVYQARATGNRAFAVSKRAEAAAAKKGEKTSLVQSENKFSATIE